MLLTNMKEWYNIILVNKREHDLFEGGITNEFNKTGSNSVAQKNVDMDCKGDSKK